MSNDTFNFQGLPPEINSARMYLGSGNVLPNAADDVSAAIAALFAAHGQEYQTLASQAEAFHDQFVHHYDLIV
jgi:PPE-repeat protein